MGALTFGLGKLFPEFGPSKSSGGPPMIRVLPGGGVGVEISGRPGLYIAPSEKQALGYALVNGAREVVSGLITSFLGELFPEWEKDTGTSPSEKSEQDTSSIPPTRGPRQTRLRYNYR